MRIAVPPHEAQAPLIVDPNAMLPLAFAAQRLKTIPRRRCQVRQSNRPVQQEQFSSRHSLDGTKAADILVSKQSLGLLATKTPDHKPVYSVTRNTSNGMIIQRVQDRR
jgi:hypothetical protein